jgi:hypothetical protein
MKDLYVLVWRSDDPHIDDLPVSPLDENPESDDPGMLVYSSLRAAQLAAEYQDQLYGEAFLCVPVKLSTYLETKCEI